MIGVFLQNRVTMTGYLMVLLSENDLTYPLYDVSCYGGSYDDKRNVRNVLFFITFFTIS